jgi:acyl-coenzyme A thioesterase 13
VSAIPAGFVPIGPSSPFNELVGPFYAKRDGATLALGMVVEPKHQNSRGIVHGGMICTLIDFALGYAARYATDPPRNLVTTSLSVDFAANARPGDWIEARTDVMRPGTRVAFINCFVYVGEIRIARGSGIFQVLRSAE